MLLMTSLVAVVFLIAGFALHPIGLDPDSFFGITPLIGSFFIFLFFIQSVCGWGKVLAYILGIEDAPLFVKIALGSALISLVFLAYGSIGVIGSSWITLAILTLLAGGFGAEALQLKKKPALWQFSGYYNRPLVLIFTSVFF